MFIHKFVPEWMKLQFGEPGKKLKGKTPNTLKKGAALYVNRN
jgi:hypothetical protein